MRGSIAVLGLGGMGSGMARALLASGARVAVFNRSREKAEPLARAGATVAESPGEAVAGAAVVLLSLADQDAVDQVLFGELARRLPPGTTVVDTSTVGPGYARKAAARLGSLGIAHVEACVLGNPEMAAAGRLRIFVAGADAAVAGVSELLATLGQDVRHLGATGNAGTLKLAFNLMLGIQLLGLAEAVRFVEAMGLERVQLLDAFEDSGWRSAVLSFRGTFMRRRRYRPAAFRTTLMHKDLELVARELPDARIELPMLRQATLLYADVLASGHGEDDAAVVAEHGGVEGGGS